ncbi:MAG: alpha/beta hydrolase [Cyclobacteriaceae bacterium]|nr:alpha/beta hydrolase [Cyclobacteriaceae bacterium]
MSLISFESAGSGSPIVLLHGYIETRYIWHRLRPRLASNLQVLTPDLPGFGESESLGNSFSLTEVASAMLEWIQTVGLHRPIVIGHSLGGYVAQEMALLNQDMLGGIGLFHSTMFADSEEKQVNRNRVIEFLSKNPVETFTNTFVPGLFHQKEHEEIPKLKKLAAGQQASAIISYAAAMRDRPDYSTQWLAQITLPTLVIAGTHDTVIPLEISQKMTHFIKNPSFCVLPESGHMGFFENEEESLEAIKLFLYAL